MAAHITAGLAPGDAVALRARTSPQFFAGRPRSRRRGAAIGAPNQGAARPQRLVDPRTREMAMQAAGSRIQARVWRELGQLAMEGIAVGLVFSVLLAAAVYMVAHNGAGADMALAPPAEAALTLASAPQ
jgi:hypothetical protein